RTANAGWDRLHPPAGAKSSRARISRPDDLRESPVPLARLRPPILDVRSDPPVDADSQPRRAQTPPGRVAAESPGGHSRPEPPDAPSGSATGPRTRRSTRLDRPRLPGRPGDASRAAAPGPADHRGQRFGPQRLAR